MVTSGSTYSLSDGGIHQETREERNIFTHADRLNHLTAGNIGVHGVVEHGRNKCWHALDHRCWVCAIENVVGQEGLDGHGVIGREGCAS